MDKISVIMALCAVVLCFFLPLVYHRIINNSKESLKAFRQMYDGLFSLYKEDTAGHAGYDQWYLWRKFVFAYILVFWQHNPTAQYIMACVAQSAFAIVLMVYRPYLHTPRNVLRIISEVFLSIGMGFLIGYPIIEHYKEDAGYYSKLGWWSSMCFCISLLCDSVAMFLSTKLLDKMSGHKKQTWRRLILAKHSKQVKIALKEKLESKLRRQRVENEGAEENAKSELENERKREIEKRRRMNLNKLKKR